MTGPHCHPPEQAGQPSGRRGGGFVRDDLASVCKFGTFDPGRPTAENGIYDDRTFDPLPLLADPFMNAAATTSG